MNRRLYRKLWKRLSTFILQKEQELGHVDFGNREWFINRGSKKALRKIYLPMMISENSVDKQLESHCEAGWDRPKSWCQDLIIR